MTFIIERNLRNVVRVGERQADRLRQRQKERHECSQESMGLSRGIGGGAKMSFLKKVLSIFKIVLDWSTQLT